MPHRCALPRNTRAVSKLAGTLVLVVIFVGGLFLYAWFSGYSPANILIQRRGGTESVVLNSYSLKTTENVTLYLKNTGSVTSTIVKYTVRDSGGDYYYNGNFTGPTINPNEIKPATVLIGNECASQCQLVGNTFIFRSGTSYTVVLVTARNNQFSVSIGS